MKRILSVLIAAALSLTICACGNTTNSLSQSIESSNTTDSTKISSSNSKESSELADEAFDNIQKAISMIDEFATDQHEIWYLGIFEADSVRDEGVSFLTPRMHYLSKDDVIEALKLDAKHRAENGGKGFTDEILNDPDLYLSLLTDENIRNTCSYALTLLYEENGKADEITMYLEDAKAAIKELNEKYPGTESYDLLKNLYTTVSSYYNDCFNELHSFEEFTNLEEQYGKEIDELISDLEFELD